MWFPFHNLHNLAQIPTSCANLHKLPLHSAVLSAPATKFRPCCLNNQFSRLPRNWKISKETQVMVLGLSSKRSQKNCYMLKFLAANVVAAKNRSTVYCVSIFLVLSTVVNCLFLPFSALWSEMGVLGLIQKQIELLKRVLKFTKAGLTGLGPKWRETIDIKGQSDFFRSGSRYNLDKNVLRKFHWGILRFWWQSKMSKLCIWKNVSFCRGDDKENVHKNK